MIRAPKHLAQFVTIQQKRRKRISQIDLEYSTRPNCQTVRKTHNLTQDLLNTIQLFGDTKITSNGLAVLENTFTRCTQTPVQFREFINRLFPGAFQPGKIMLIEETLDLLFFDHQDIDSLLTEPLFKCNIHLDQTQHGLDQLSIKQLAYLTVVLDVCIKTLIACCLQITTMSGQIGASQIEYLLTQPWSILEKELARAESICTIDTLRVLKGLRITLQ